MACKVTIDIHALEGDFNACCGTGGGLGPGDKAVRGGDRVLDLMSSHWAGTFNLTNEQARPVQLLTKTVKEIKHGEVGE